MDEEFTLAPDGTFRTYTITGHTTFGSLVNEQFSRKGTAAEWRTDADQGQTTVTGSALYVPVNSSSLGNCDGGNQRSRPAQRQRAAAPAGRHAAHAAPWSRST